MPDITKLSDYLSAQIAAVVLILLFINMVRAYLEQRWGKLFSNLIFAILCYMIVSFPQQFESLAVMVWTKITSGGLG